MHQSAYCELGVSNVESMRFPLFIYIIGLSVDAGKIVLQFFRWNIDCKYNCMQGFLILEVNFATK
jgi:hypothetical protein